MVTSFRPKSPFMKDDTVLTTVRPISDLSELYGQVTEYQLENMEERLRSVLKIIRESKQVGQTNTKVVKGFLEEEIRTLTHLNNEIVDEKDVRRGKIREDIENERIAKRSKME